jgi:hypothetical protein
MRRSGRVHWVTVAGSVGFAVILALFLIPTNSPNVAANRFMSALAEGNVDKLMSLSYYKGDEARMRAQWEFAVKECAPYYRFKWRNVGLKEADDKIAGVRMMVQRNLGSGSDYEERYDIPLLKVDGEWLVDVRSISRAMYPGIPR